MYLTPDELETLMDCMITAEWTATERLKNFEERMKSGVFEIAEQGEYWYKNEINTIKNIVMIKACVALELDKLKADNKGN